MPVTDSPLRYPGGKSQLAPFVAALARANGLDRGIYAEPFAGGAGLACRLLMRGDMVEAWINDIDPRLYAFWSTAVYQPDRLCERILKAKVTIKEWRLQRAILCDASASDLDRAFATLFLNRTNRSGILSGGVIGGERQRGTYKLDCRFKRDQLVSKIQRLHLYRDVIKVTRLDARECLQRWAKVLPPRSLVNIDPPYYCQGRDLYLSHYSPKDHEMLARQIRRLRIQWMLTYDDVPQIKQLYAGLPLFHSDLIYYAQVKRHAQELMVLSPRLRLPPANTGHVTAQATATATETTVSSTSTEVIARQRVQRRKRTYTVAPAASAVKLTASNRLRRAVVP